jgi:hypothetical protein
MLPQLSAKQIEALKGLGVNTGADKKAEDAPKTNVNFQQVSEDK